MAVDENGILYYTWYTEGEDGIPNIFLSISTDKGRTFAMRQTIPVGNRVFPDHPRLAVGRGGIAYIVWEEKTPVISRILFASYQDGKGFSRPEQLSHGVRKSAEPVAAVNSDGTVFIGWAYDEIRFTKTMIRIIK